MDHRKVSLDPKDLKRLAALLKEEEARVDAMSESELLAEEKALEEHIRDFAEGQGISESAKDSMSSNWEEIRHRFEASSQSVKEEQLGRIVPLQHKKKSLPWLTIGGLAAAALAVVVIYPKPHTSEKADPGDYGQQVKGAGVGASAGFCDVDLTGKSPESVEETGSGQGYIVTPDENFQISAKCDAPGFVQLWSLGAPATEFRNIPVARNIRAAIAQDGKEVEFKFKGRLPMEYAIVLTDKPISNEIDLFDGNEIPEAKTLGTASILWSDIIHVKGK